MADPHVISGLESKRADIDGELRRLEGRVVELRGQRDTIDAAILVFDPSRAPHRIKPRAKRLKPGPFRHGECARAVMGMLRTADGPLTVGDIVERLVADYHLAATSAGDRDALARNVRNALGRHTGKGLARERRGGKLVWRVA